MFDCRLLSLLAFYAALCSLSRATLQPHLSLLDLGECDCAFARLKRTRLKTTQAIFDDRQQGLVADAIDAIGWVAFLEPNVDAGPRQSSRSYRIRAGIETNPVREEKIL